MHFLSAPDLKPTQIQPLATEQLIPAVLTRKPATRARLMRALLKGGTLGGVRGIRRVLVAGGGALSLLAA
jgi:hypothetical protein